MSEYKAQRIMRSKAVLDFYRDNYDDGEADAEVLSDLLADLMHYAEAGGDDPDNPLDFDYELERARHHYEEERSEEAEEARWRAEEDPGLPLPPGGPSS